MVKRWMDIRREERRRKKIKREGRKWNKSLIKLKSMYVKNEGVEMLKSKCWYVKDVMILKKNFV
jgi:hypothetical protein